MSDEILIEVEDGKIIQLSPFLYEQQLEWVRKRYSEMGIPFEIPDDGHAEISANV